MLNDKDRRYGITKILSLQHLKKCLQDESFDFLEYAVLFGSRAVGNAHLQSDYDIAVYAKPDQKPKWGTAAEVWGVLGRRCGLDDCDLDIVDLATAPKGLLDSIAEGYKILKGDKDGFSELLAKLRRSR